MGERERERTNSLLYRQLKLLRPNYDDNDIILRKHKNGLKTH